MSRNVKDKLFAVHHAERLLADALRADYPAGAPIRWKRAGREQGGHVVQHSFGGRIEVENDRTLRLLWIRAYDIL